MTCMHIADILYLAKKVIKRLWRQMYRYNVMETGD